MGHLKVDRESAAEQLRAFTKKILADLQALERMLGEESFETGVRRIGAEQEIFLVDKAYRAAPVSMEVLAEIDDPHFTTELGRFNIECNLDPQDLKGSALAAMESQLQELVKKARRAAQRVGADIVLTGILPTLSKADLTLDNMTPMPRYYALNEAMTRQRGADYEFRIKGPDELIVSHDNVMLESCNTSFQVHFQVGPDEFAPLYNIAQAVTAPVLATGSNSPLLFGRRLWRETRIALFQQSIDTRQATAHLREQQPRVSFGTHWIDDSVLEIFREDVTRFRVLLSIDIDEDPFAELDAGKAPKLTALRLHNGTVYRWNRPCYGISANGLPHLRIENRVLPAGPTTFDEMANAAFWYGLMKGVSEEFPDITKVMSFDTARENFIAAARLGLAAQFTWPGYESVPAQELICKHLLPLAREGLQAMKIDSQDVDRFLGAIGERVERQRTGAQWLVQSLVGFGTDGTRAERLAALVAGSMSREQSGKPIHEWDLASLAEAGGWQQHYSRVEHLMTTDLFTVNEDELIDLVASLMDWQHIRHVPVEDNDHRLVGLVTHRNLLRVLARGVGRGEPVPVSRIMHREIVTIGPEASTVDAITLMRKHKVACLPVVKDDKLVGIITERDFMGIAGQLLEDKLRSESE